MKYNTDDLILLNMAGIGSVRLKKLMDLYGGIDKILESSADDLCAINDIGPLLSERISGIKLKTGLKEEKDLIARRGVKVITLFDENYPELLKEIYDPPLVLYVRGGLLPDDRTAVAMVGSRKASLYGVNVCRTISRGLASSGVVIVSGLARGVDSAAHRAALESSGRTIAVLGSGLNRIYPPENEGLASCIASSGAVISEFPMNTPPIPRNFPVRNRIISGLSLGVVVVEAARRSGALITARCALEQAREVFAVPGKAGAATSAGTHSLIKEGARLAEGAGDIIDELNLRPVAGYAEGAERRVPGGPRPVLDKKEGELFELLSDDALHIDDIVDRSSLSFRDVNSLLLKLEMKRLVRQLPGKSYSRA